MPYLGAHMSIAGGLHQAFARISAVQGEALQIFIKNQRQWRSPAIEPEAGRLFTKAWQQWGGRHVAAHASYLINLASTNSATAEKSITGLAEELNGCQNLGIPWLIMHPGSHGGMGPQKGLQRLGTNLDAAFKRAEKTTSVQLLLETTAGQGTALGAIFEELAVILSTSRFSDRLGVCFDTAHTFAAGYDLRTPTAYEITMQRFDRIIGLERIKFFHLNDSKRELGSRVDRHEHIGKGQIGTDGFGLLLNDPRFSEHPMILETPKDETLAEDRENLAILRALQTKRKK